MFLSLFFQLLWLWTHLKFPYIFPAIAAIPYYFNLNVTNLDLMVASPLSFYQIIRELQAGQRPKHPEVLTIELIRWFVILLTGDNHLVMSGYCYLMLMERLGVSNSCEIKIVWHLLWLGYLSWTGSLLAMVIHLLDFRLTSLSWNFITGSR